MSEALLFKLAAYIQDRHWSIFTIGVSGETEPSAAIPFSTWLLKDGEDKYVADRLVEIFSAAVVPGAKKS
jgi:hypothetical protein